MKLNSRDRGLLWFKAETGEHRVVPAKVAAQLLLTEISNKILTEGKREKGGKRRKNLKTSHSVTVREGLVIWASLSGLRT